MTEVTLLVSGESENRVFNVDAKDENTAISQALSKLMADWSLDDRVNTEVEVVGVRPQS